MAFPLRSGDGWHVDWVRERSIDGEDLQGECLTLLTNIIVCWNTVYIRAAIHKLDESEPVADDT